MTYVRTGTVEVCASTSAADVAGIADDVARRGAPLDGVWFGFWSRGGQDGREGGDEDGERKTHDVIKLVFFGERRIFESGLDSDDESLGVSA